MLEMALQVFIMVCQALPVTKLYFDAGKVGAKREISWSKMGTLKDVLFQSASVGPKGKISWSKRGILKCPFSIS